MKAMRIHHRNGGYEVRFESVQAAFSALPADVRIITDANVAKHYGELLSAHPHFAATPGEPSKSLKCYGDVLSWLAASKASRRTTVCAFGGGVVGDLAGFAAATFMRGVPFYQIPTTLLAQVDSSVGGKVGIDLAEGKNLAGAFYPPTGVSIAIETLSTLPDRQFTNGMAEVWKYGFIMDRDLIQALLAETWHARHPDLPRIVGRCIELKAQVVEADEYENTGLRAILNFGHTIGHAIEWVTGYGALLHGEAISVGMVAEARLGEKLGVTRCGVSEQVREYLQGQGLPVTHDSLGMEDELLTAMRGDKKAAGGNLAFSLLTDIGGCKLIEHVPEDVVKKALQAS